MFFPIGWWAVAGARAAACTRQARAACIAFWKRGRARLPLLLPLTAVAPFLQGTIPGSSQSYRLDQDTAFVTGKWYEVSGNTGARRQTGL